MRWRLVTSPKPCPSRAELSAAGDAAASIAVKSRRQRGGSSVEYILVLALVVIPLALMSPMLQEMIRNYTQRIVTIIRLPLG
jgi:hypothetical protein